MRIDHGKKTNDILANTAHLAAVAQQILTNQIKQFAGRDVFGRSGIELYWEAGQIVEVRQPIEVKTR